MVAPRQLRMTPPAQSGIIDRARLAPLLDGQPVVVLAGMAGYGKSTVLSAAHRQRDRGATVWLTLDDTDKDPMRLVADLVRPPDWRHRCHERPGEAAWTSSLRTEPLALVDSLLEVLYDRAEPLLLALDDLQHLAGSAASTTIIDHLLRWAPANMRIAIAARVVPPLRLQRLRLEDRLTYLAHDELAFTAEESVAAVRAAGLDLTGQHGRHDPHSHGGGPPACVWRSSLPVTANDLPT